MNKKKGPGLMFPKVPVKRKRKIHPRSILQEKDGRCFLCMRLEDDQTVKDSLEEHHAFEGNANRAKSEQYGLKYYLCIPHHRTGKEAAHTNKEVRDFLHKYAQKVFEEKYSHELFLQEFKGVNQIGCNKSIL